MSIGTSNSITLPVSKNITLPVSNNVTLRCPSQSKTHSILEVKMCEIKCKMTNTKKVHNIYFFKDRVFNLSLPVASSQ